MNEFLSLEESERQLKLKPLGMGTFGQERDKALTPKEAADYLWDLACKHL